MEIEKRKTILYHLTLTPEEMGELWDIMRGISDGAVNHKNYERSKKWFEFLDEHNSTDGFNA